MRRRAQMGLLALTLVAGPAWAEWQDPEVAGVGDAVVRQNLMGTVWSRFEQEVVALQARVAGLDQAKKRASVSCKVGRKDRGIIFTDMQDGADCELASGGEISQIRDQAAALFADSRLEPLAESKRTHSTPSYGYGYMGAGMPTTPSTYYTFQPRGVFDKLQQAKSFGYIPKARVWKDDVVGEGVAVPEFGYQDRYLAQRPARGFFERMNTELAAAAEAVRSYRAQHKAIAQTIADLIKEDNSQAVSERRNPNWDISGESRFPHADLAGVFPSYASLELPGDDDKHPGTVARIQNGYVWFTKYGVAAYAAVGNTGPEETEPERTEAERTEPIRTEEGTVTEVEPLPDVTGDLLGTELYDAVEDDDGTVRREEPPPTATELRNTYDRTSAISNSQNLYAGLLPIYTSGMWQEGMTPENQAARELAARSLNREVNFLGLGLDASDPARPRNGWDHGDTLPEGVSIEAVEEQREALLLSIFALEPTALNESLYLTGLSSLETDQEAFEAFYGGQGNTLGAANSLIATSVRPATTQHISRIDGAAARLPEETRTKIATELAAYRQAAAEYHAALDDLGNFEGLDPLLDRDKPIPTEQAAAKARVAATKLAAMRTAAEALSQAAQRASGPQAGK